MMIGKSLFAMASITVGCLASAQGSFDACLASKLAERPGQISAAVAARKTCRDEFPLTAEEIETLKLRAQAKPVAAASTTGTVASPLPVAGVTAPVGSGSPVTPTVTTPALAATPSVAAPPPAAPSVPAPVSVPIPAPAMSPGAGHGPPAGVPKH